MNPSSRQFDIAIVGGGMVGAALACLLATARGWRIALLENFPVAGLDRSFQPSFDDRATAVAHGSVDLLRQAGIWEELQQHATAIRQVHVTDRGHFGGALIDSREHAVDALGHVVANARIGRALLARLRQLQNVELLAPARVVRLQALAESMKLQVALDGENLDVDAQLTVVADGADSPLARSLGIHTEIQPYQQSAIIANVDCEQPHAGVAYERFTDEGPLAMLPMNGDDGRRVAMVWTQPSTDCEALLELTDTEFLDRLQQRFGYRLGRLLCAGRRDSYSLALCRASEQVRSRLVIMGNAAHFLHPVAGQGFNLALRDCAALTEALIESRQSPGSLEALQAYVQAQELDQLATIGFTDRLTRVFSNSSLPLAALRALGFLGLEFLPAAKSLLARQTMGKAHRDIARAGRSGSVDVPAAN